MLWQNFQWDLHLSRAGILCVESSDGTSSPQWNILCVEMCWKSSQGGRNHYSKRNIKSQIRVCKCSQSSFFGAICNSPKNVKLKPLVTMTIITFQGKGEQHCVTISSTAERLIALSFLMAVPARNQWWLSLTVIYCRISEMFGASFIISHFIKESLLLISSLLSAAMDGGC